MSYFTPRILIQLRYEIWNVLMLFFIYESHFQRQFHFFTGLNIFLQLPGYTM